MPENFQKDRQTHTDVLATLGQILEGGAIGEKSRLRQLLRYLVTEEIEGRGDRLKAYTIGTEVFGRSDNFDPSSDSIVRVEVNRLRQSLDHFYSTEGSTAVMRIEIPKGTYRPSFVPQNEDTTADPRPQSKTLSRIFRTGRIVPILVACSLAAVVLIFLSAPFDAPDAELDRASDVVPGAIRVVVQSADEVEDSRSDVAVSKRIVRDLRSALSRNPAIEVVGEKATRADFRIDSAVQDSGGAAQYSIEVTNAHSDAIVWARVYDLETENDDHERSLIKHVSRELRTRLLGATKNVLEGRDPGALSAEQLFVMATWVSGPAISAVEWEKERLALARLAVAKDPEFGPAYSVLADKIAYLAAVDATMNSEVALEEAERSWRRAMELSPLDANVVFNVAQGQWHSGRVAASVRSMTRVVELDPTHALASFFADVYPYTCSVAPDEVMKSTIAFDRQLAADDPIRWITLTWTAWLHMYREEYDLALDAEERAAQIFQIPYTTIRHAVLLNLKGRVEDAHHLIEAQRNRWPNIDPSHFADVTMPRLCAEKGGGDRFIDLYHRLVGSLEERR
ncbi:MAG: tetratricopeptide repeat protein [Paracoccaceae bacterium]